MATRKSPSRVKIELDDILERVTRAETQMEADRSLATDRHEAYLRAAEQTNERLATLEKALAKYTGFWGGIVLILSAVGTFLMLAKEFFAKKLGVGE